MQKQLMEDREEDRGGEKAAEFVRGADHRTHRPQRLATAHWADHERLDGIEWTVAVTSHGRIRDAVPATHGIVTTRSDQPIPSPTLSQLRWSRLERKASTMLVMA